MILSFSGTLLRFVNYQRKITLEAGTVQHALAQLVARHPEVRPVIYDGNGQVRQVHRISINGELMAPDDLDRGLNHDDEVRILTSIAGG